jgi:hypothetical protein
MFLSEIPQGHAIAIDHHPVPVRGSRAGGAQISALGLAICILCLIVYLKPDPPGADER